MTARPAATPTTAPRGAPRPRHGSGMLAEAAMLPGLLAVYSAGRAVAAGHVASAFDHAMDVWRWQHAAGLPSELSVQQ